MSRKYQLGTLVRIRGEFKNVGGAYIDPDTVSCQVSGPNSNVTYTYNPGAIVREAVGRYYVSISPGVGKWVYTFLSTGEGQGVDSGKFEVA